MNLVPDGPILVPVDYSEHSEQALLWAAGAAEAFGGRLLVLHVVHDLEFSPGYYKMDDPEGHIRRLEEAAANMMQSFLDQAREQNPHAKAILDQAETVLAVGLPPTRILEVAESAGASLIVMGSHGRTGLEHLLLGSNSERVAQFSPIPVTIVKLPDWTGKD